MLKERDLNFDWGDESPNRQYSNFTSANGSMSAALANGWGDAAFQKRWYFERKKFADVSLTDIDDSIGGYERFYSTKNRKPYFNNCDHSRVRGVNAAHGVFLQKDGYCFAYPFYRRKPFCPVQTVETLQKHFAVNLQPAQRAAYWTMQPRFEGNISMFNFIAELKDFKSLAKLMLKGDKIFRLKRFFSKKSLWKKIKDPSKPIAQLHLTNEFAVKPLLSDVVEIACQINDVVSEAQKSFADAGLGRSSRHYSEYFTIEEAPCWESYYVGKYPERFEGVYKDLLFTATMEHSYEYTTRGPIDAFMRYWGLTPTKEAVWNLIPFSFLVDYVLTVGKSIKAMEVDKNVSVNISQYCESLLSRQLSGSCYRAANLLGGSIIINGRVVRPSGPTLVAGMESTLFTRRVTEPNKGTVLPRLRIPSSKQGRNVAALLRCFF